MQSSNQPTDESGFTEPNPLPLRSGAPNEPPNGDSLRLPNLEGYQFVSKLGAGGMGSVWRAIQHFPNRQVALKLLNTERLSSDTAKRRFDREVEVASLLEHPNIARVYESGNRQGVYYYAMELINGVNLDEYIAQHKLTLSKLVRLIETICRAVQHAHQNGVIHRDLKPTNIIVDRAGVPHVVDFGLGKLLGESAHPITLEGEFAGTPAYMSPEQAAGKIDQVDTRSDVYSLGVILYEAVTGRLPHSPHGSQLAVLHRVIYDEIARPRSISKVIDRDLESLILKATARSRDERYGSAGALADDIAAYLGGDPLTSRHTTLPYLLRKALTKYRAPILGAALGFSAIVGLVVYASIRITHERNIAVAAAASESIQRHTAELRLADSLVLLADSFAREQRWQEARKKYTEARGIDVAQGVPTLNTDLGLLDVNWHSPNELTTIRPHTALPFVPVGIHLGEAQSIWMVLPDGTVPAYNLATAKAVGTVGERITNGQVVAAVDFPEAQSLCRVVNEFGDDGGRICEVQTADLRNRSIHKEHTLSGIFGGVLAATRDGKYLVAQGWLGDVRAGQPRWNLWLVDNSPGSQPTIVESHVEQMRAVAISSDQKTIATGDLQGRIRIWDVAGPDEIRATDTANGVPGASEPHEITSLAFAPDNSGLLVGDHRGCLGFLSFNQTKISGKWGAHDDRIGAIAYSADGQLAVTGDDSGTVCLWNTQRALLYRVFYAGSGIRSLQFSQDNRELAAVTASGDVHVWPVDLSENPICCQFPLQPACIAISPDGLVAAIGTSKDVNIVDVATGRQLWTYSLPEQVTAVEFGAESKSVNIAMKNGDICRCELYSEWRKFNGFESSKALAHLPDLSTPDRTGRQVLVCLANCSDFALEITHGRVIGVDLTTERVLGSFDEDFALTGAISRDGRKGLVVGFRPRREIHFFDFTTGSQSELPLETRAFPKAVVFSPDARTGYIAFDDGSLSAIELASGHRLWLQASHQQAIRSLIVSPDGNALLSGASDGTIRLWAAADGYPLRGIASGLGAVTALAMTSGSELILSDGAPNDGICLWDALNPIRLQQLKDEAVATIPGASTVRARGKAAVVERYSLQRRFDWVDQLAKEADLDQDAELALARSRWQNGEFEQAASLFDTLAKRAGNGTQARYLKACANAAKR